MANLGAIEKKTIIYGSQKAGRWESLTGEEYLEASKVYQFNYRVSEVPILQWLPWYQFFEPEKYIAKLREEIAGKMQVEIEEIEIPWFYYDPETRDFKLQMRYMPREQEPAVAALFLTLLGISAVIISVTMFITMFGVIFRESPILESIQRLFEEAAEWLEKFAVVMKYGLYMVIAGGSIWLAGTIISKLGKKGART